MGSLFDELKKTNGSIQDFTQIMNMNTRKKRYLQNAFLQLTPFCNLKCEMCYARLEPEAVSAAGKHVMNFEEWKYYIDAMADMGVFGISLTGGECTIHPDFSDIYAYAYDKGFTVSVLTNGTYLPDSIIDLFKKRPPSSISMTLYGSSPETYEALCKNRNAYYSAYRNIDTMLQCGFPLSLKSTIVKKNLADYADMLRFSNEKKLQMLATSNIAPLDNCDANQFDASFVDKEVFTEIARQVETEDTGHTMEEIREREISAIAGQLEKIKNIPVQTKGFLCSAALNACNIDWEGYMVPCIGLDAYREDPRKIGFAECWQKMTAWAIDVPTIIECQKCIYKLKCSSCAAVHYSDTGELGKVSPRLCWKLQHPEEVAEINAKLKERGIELPDEL